MRPSWLSTARWMASSRRRSGGARSGGMVKVSSSHKVSWKRVSASSRAEALAESDSGGRLGAHVASGSSSIRRRSVASATRYADTSASACCAVSSWRVMATSTTPCSSCASLASASATEGPMVPSQTAVLACGPRRLASSSRRSTQVVFRLHSSATARTDSPSLSTRDATMRASSSAVNMRGGAFAARMSRLWSTGDDEGSTTTGTWLCPAARQRARRLCPSSTSYRPSPASATRRGNSAASGPCGCSRPGRRGA